jgi:hypothetical protein
VNKGKGLGSDFVMIRGKKGHGALLHTIGNNFDVNVARAALERNFMLPLGGLKFI